MARDIQAAVAHISYYYEEATNARVVLEHSIVFATPSADTDELHYFNVQYCSTVYTKLDDFENFVKHQVDTSAPGSNAATWHLFTSCHVGAGVVGLSSATGSG